MTSPVYNKYTVGQTSIVLQNMRASVKRAGIELEPALERHVPKKVKRV